MHGILDYIIGLALIAAPWLFGFADGGSETWIPVIIGATVIISAMATNYELGVVKMLSMKAHLGLDVVAGGFLAVSPWIFGYVDYVWIPHLVVGLFMVGSGLMTEKVPYRDTPTAHHA